MMELVEEMVEKIAIDLQGTTVLQVGEHKIDFKRPWRRLTMFDAIKEYAGVDISEMSEEQLFATAQKLGVDVDKTMGKGKIIDEIFGEMVEGKLIQPTFITDYPIEMSPLAKKHRNKEGLVERFEAICNGKELCNAYSELNDPIDQRERFEHQLMLGKRGDEEAMLLDEDFLRAIEFGMPPTAGLGIGIDRLTMMMTNSNSIQDVIFFPQMKPEHKPKKDSSEKFKEIGIPEEWIPVAQKIGYHTAQSLKDINPNKFHQELCGANKKFKLELKNPSNDDVKQWIANLNKE